MPWRGHPPQIFHKYLKRPDSIYIVSWVLVKYNLNCCESKPSHSAESSANSSAPLFSASRRLCWYYDYFRCLAFFSLVYWYSRPIYRWACDCSDHLCNAEVNLNLLLNKVCTLIRSLHLVHNKIIVTMGGTVQLLLLFLFISLCGYKSNEMCYWRASVVPYTFWCKRTTLLVHGAAHEKRTKTRCA